MLALYLRAISWVMFCGQRVVSGRGDGAGSPESPGRLEKQNSKRKTVMAESYLALVQLSLGF